MDYLYLVFFVLGHNWEGRKLLGLDSMPEGGLFSGTVPT